MSVRSGPLMCRMPSCREMGRAQFPGLGERDAIHSWPREEGKALGALEQPSGFPGTFPVLKCIGCVSAVPSKQGVLCPSSLASFPTQDPDDWQSIVNDKPHPQIKKGMWQVKQALS